MRSTVVLCLVEGGPAPCCPALADDFSTLPASPTFSVGDKALDGYSKKKYVCKLLFIFLLGHDIDFGHMEAVNLLSSNRYTEKQIVSVTEGLEGWGRGWHRGHLRWSQGLPPL